LDAYSDLTPRQPITAAPYAIYAGGASAAGLSGVLPSASLAGIYGGAVTLNNAANAFSGNGSALTSLNASELTSGTVPDARLGPNVSLLGPTIESAEITDGTIVDADISGSAKIADTKLATIETIGKVADSALSGNVSLLGQAIDSAEIADGAIVNADISGGAAIADSKLATIATAGKVANSALSTSVSLLGQTIESAEIADGTIAAGDVNAASFNTTFWRTAGNSSTTAGVNFLGTTDDEPLELKVNGLRAFRLEPNAEIAPNIIGGASVNWVAPDVVGATIGGGGTLNYLGLGFAESNSIRSDFGTIGGGWSNVITTVAGSATIGGGFGNVAGGPDATVGGGSGNVADGTRATIVGGLNNKAGGDWTFIGGGSGNVAGNLYGVIAGGAGNDVFGSYSAIGGGSGNLVDAGADYSVVAGGRDNIVALDYANISGGRQNTNAGNYSAIGGGLQNNIAFSADYAYAAGRRAKVNHDGAFVWADSTDADFASIANNEFAVRASGGVRIIGSSTNGSLMVAPNETLDGDDSQLLLAEDHDGTFGMLIRYDGTTNQLQILGKVANGPTSPYLIMERGTGNVGFKRTPSANDLEVEGTASKTTAGSWLANSDARIKRDIQPVIGALDKLSQVRLVSFQYTDAYRLQHPSLESRRYLNVIAQEFAEVFPEHVKSSGEKLPDGSEILQVDTYPLTIYSAAAVQELNRKVEERTRKLEAQNTKLQQQNAELETRLSALEKFMKNLTVAQGGE
jgi:hypothetical protein